MLYKKILGNACESVLIVLGKKMLSVIKIPTEKDPYTFVHPEAENTACVL